MFAMTLVMVAIWTGPGMFLSSGLSTVIQMFWQRRFWSLRHWPSTVFAGFYAVFWSFAVTAIIHLFCLSLLFHLSQVFCFFLSGFFGHRRVLVSKERSLKKAFLHESLSVCRLCTLTDNRVLHYCWRHWHRGLTACCWRLTRLLTQQQRSFFILSTNTNHYQTAPENWRNGIYSYFGRAKDLMSITELLTHFLLRQLNKLIISVWHFHSNSIN